MRHMPIEHRGAFVLNGREIVDGDRLELKWPDGQTVTTIVKLMHDELRIVGTVHGVKSWFILDHGVRRREVLARWPEGGDGYGA